MNIMPYVRRIGRIYPDFVLGTGNEAFSTALKARVENRAATNQGYFSSVWSGIKDGARAAEKHNTDIVKQRGGFWRSTWEDLRTTPSLIKDGWKTAGAGKTGFGKYWSKFLGAGKSLGKRMPLIGSILCVAFELPNIISAFKDKGIIGGTVETGKAGLRLGAGMTGAAIGQALIPIPLVGGIVGYMAGDWLMSKLTGKSHTEKKAEAQEALAQADMSSAQAQALQQQLMTNPNMFAQNPYGQSGLGQTAIPQPTMNMQQVMAMQQMLRSGYGLPDGNYMDQDFMAMTSGMNNLNQIGQMNPYMNRLNYIG